MAKTIKRMGIYRVIGYKKAGRVFDVKQGGYRNVKYPIVESKSYDVSKGKMVTLKQTLSDSPIISNKVQVPKRFR